MKKILYLLLCAASVALVSCNGNEPEKKEQESNEGDFVVKFYTNDSLLQYVTWTVKDTCDAKVDCSKATIARADTAKADQKDWEKIQDIMKVASDSCSLNHSNIRIITLPVHLSSGKHVFQLTYTYNGKPFQSAEIDVMDGGSYHSTTAKYSSKFSYSAGINEGLETKNFSTFLPILNRKCRITVQF